MDKLGYNLSMAKTIKQVTIEIDNLVKSINQDLQVSPPSKLLSTANLGVLAQGAILGMAKGPLSSLAKEAIEQAGLWEKRQVVYGIHYPEKPEGYGEALKAYQSMGEMTGAIGQSPDKAARVEVDLSWSRQSLWLTAKEVLERMMGKKLPDIDPQDAIELGKTTPYSAEQWFRGCSDREFYDVT